VGTCGGHIAASIFFPIVDMCLSCEDIARQSCAMLPIWRFWRLFCVLCFQRAACSRFQTCILNLHKGHTMFGSMADIQSVAAEIRREKKKKKRRKNKLLLEEPSALFHRATIIKCLQRRTI